ITAATPVYSSDETETAFVADEFIRWAGEQDADKPWFAHISFIRPHPPFMVPAPYNAMYAPDEGPGFARSANLEDEAALHPLHAAALSSVKTGGFVPGVEGLAADLSEAEFRQI